MIGLFTPYKIQNYGTKLQAYAVQQILRTYGDVQVIDYEPSLTSRLIHKPESMRNMRYLDQQLQVSNTGINEELLEQRNKAIDSFDGLLAKSKPLVGKTKLAAYTSKRYDAVVCGSDQIWNPINLARHVFMLEFVPRNTRKVAFSPSFGVDSIPSSLKATYRRRLRSIDYFSAREESGVRILHDLGFNDVTWTLDPTLALSNTCWQELATRPPDFPLGNNEPFLFCYFLGNRTQEREAAVEIARSKNLRIITLPHFKGYVESDVGFGDVHLYDVSPQNFVWLIKNASSVCTDSFHGCAFSLQFERELFYVRRHASDEVGATNGRIASLLREFGLENRAITDSQDIAKVAGSPLEYEETKKRLAMRQEQTLTYLSRALENTP